jgi:hypothetical protein
MVIGTWKTTSHVPFAEIVSPYLLYRHIKDIMKWKDVNIFAAYRISSSIKEMAQSYWLNTRKSVDREASVRVP